MGHGLVGMVIAVVLGLFAYHAIKDWGNGELQTPAAVAHDAPLVFKEVKKEIPALKDKARDAGKQAAPHLREAADEFKNNFNKESDQ